MQSSEEEAEEGDGEEEGGEEGVDPSEEAFIQAFGETAMQGVTWLVHVMGLNLNQVPNNNNNNSTTTITGATEQQQQAPTQSTPTNV